MSAPQSDWRQGGPMDPRNDEHALRGHTQSGTVLARLSPAILRECTLAARRGEGQHLTAGELAELRALQVSNERAATIAAENKTEGRTSRPFRTNPHGE